MAEESNVLTVQPNGPNVLTGDLAIVTTSNVRRLKTAVLCRCGYSADKPFCDGTHVKVGFTDSARLPDEPAGTVGVGRLTVTPVARGPNQCDGPLTIRDIDGRTAEVASPRLCRCGASSNKPFCDGAHERTGFKD